MKSLITGGAGFLGFHLANYLLEKGEDLIICDNLFITQGRIDKDLKDLIKHPNVKFFKLNLAETDLRKELGNKKFDKIYHLASINGTRFFYEIPEQVLKQNIVGTINLLDWISKSNQQNKFLITSSCETYAGTVSQFSYPVPTDEKVPLCIEDIKNPRWSYGLSKIVQEALTFNYSKKYGFDVSVLRIHNMYGERMGKEHVIPQFIERILNKENPFKIYGADHTRSFCYKDDFVKATYTIMNSESCNNEVINIGNPKEEITMKDLALKLFDIADYHPLIDERDAPEGSVKRRCPSTEKLKNLIGYENQISLDIGLRKTFEWYKNNR